MAGSVIDTSAVKGQSTGTGPLTINGTLGKLALGAGVFCAIFFLVGELFLRIVFWDGKSFSAHRGPIVQRLERDFKFNRFDGPSRGPEPSGPKHPNGTRILIQGDSITWGQGVRNEEQLFSSRLLTRLRETNLPVDMAVLARPGREIDEHLQQLKKWGHELQPDVIIYQWYINDMELEKKHRPRTNRFWRHPHFCIPCCRRTPTIAFFGFQPRYAAPVMRPEIADIHTRVLALCRANNLVCVDLSTALTKFEDSRSIKVSPFDDHPSAEVHRVMAEALYEIFRGGTVKVLS